MHLAAPLDDSSRVLADDKFHEECGVFGVWKVPDAAALTALGLHALQRSAEAKYLTPPGERHLIGDRV